MWKRILATAHRFGFTQNEAAVVLFLSAVIIAGTVLTEVRSFGAQPVQDIRTAYRSADTAFARRSQAAPSVLENNGIAAATEDSSSMEAETSRKKIPLSGIISLNSATEQQLTTLPGIGPATAKKILAYRKEHGPFQRAEDLMNVKSIGQKKLERIREFISIE